MEELAYLANVLVAGDTSAAHGWRSVEAAERVLELCDEGLRAIAARGDRDPETAEEVLRGWGAVGGVPGGVGLAQPSRLIGAFTVAPSAGGASSRAGHPPDTLFLGAVVRAAYPRQTRRETPDSHAERRGGIEVSKPDAKARRMAPLQTPTDLGAQATKDVSAALNLLLADVFALYLKTKNFHWHVSGPHFRDYHLLLDEQADQLYATTDPIAERVRKLGGTTLRSIGQISRLQRVADNDADYVTPVDMLAELREDNQELASRMRAAHVVCEEHGDVATASLIEVWIDEAERRVWFLYEAGRK